MELGMVAHTYNYSCLGVWSSVVSPWEFCETILKPNQTKTTNKKENLKIQGARHY